MGLLEYKYLDSGSMIPWEIFAIQAIQNYIGCLSIKKSIPHCGTILYVCLEQNWE
jgi:hypothetical protein